MEKRITNQHDIDKLIELLIKRAEGELQTLFSKRLKVIKQEIAEMYAKYDKGEPYATWTEFNKYNRLNKELTRIGLMLNEDYKKVAKSIQQMQQNAYIEKYLMSLYLYEQASQVPMTFDVPDAQAIRTAIEQPIEFIKLVPTLQKQRDNVLKKIRMNITQGIISGEGYSKIAQALQHDIGMTQKQAMRVARTETGRAQSQAGLDSAKVAKNNGLNMTKRWIATKDTRTRDTHRHLDGKAIDIEENFKSSGCIGQAPKLFIGINSARENINCRCSLLYYIDEDDLPTVMRARKDDGNNEVVPFMTYNEWQKSKRKG